MAELLKLPQFIEKHGVPEMKIRGRRIEPRLHAQAFPVLEPLPQFGFDEEFVGAAFDDCQHFFYGSHDQVNSTMWESKGFSADSLFDGDSSSVKLPQR
jgi:hypothetical protein